MSKPAQTQPDVGELAQLPEAQSDGKVARGKDGWLFLDNDSNYLMRQQRGEVLFSGEQVEQWRRVLEWRVKWLRARGSEYHLLVAPNAQSVYPDKLPFEQPAGTPRPVLQLIGHLENTGSPAKLIYPLEELQRERDRHVFTPTNTHWTDLGAFVAYNALLDRVSDGLPVRRLTDGDIDF